MKKSNTTAQSTKTRVKLERYALELVVGCPVGSVNPQDCPLHQLREKSVSERTRWVKALKNDDLAYLVTYHQVCLNTKLQEEALDLVRKERAKN